MKKIFAILTGLLLVSSLAFASGNQSRTTTTASALPAGFNATGLPIVSGSTPFEINVLAVRYGSHGADVYQNDFFKNLEKTTNIKVNWDVRWNADFGEQRSLMLASGDMPEVILGNTGWSYNDHIIPNIEYFPPLENLIAQYMPNLSKIFVDDPTFKARSTYLDGHIYALPTKLPGRPQAGSVYAINQTWLTKLGLKAPTTVDELAQVLKAFVTRDPNGNGIADEVGWYRIAGSSATEFDFGLTQHHGVYGEWVMDTATNKVIYTPTSDKFRTAIQWVASLYADGALFPEYYTMTGDQYYAKGAVTNPQVFGYVLDWTPDATIQGNSKDFVVLPALIAPDGKGYNSWVDNFQLAEFEITTKCKNPEVVMRWADQLYTVDATVQTTFGSFGETTRKESNGSYTLLPLSATPDFLDLGQDTRKWWRALADCGPKYWPDSAVINMDETSGDGYKLALDRLYTPVIRPELTVQTGFSYPDELAEYARIRTDVNTYMLQTVSNWIVAGRVTDAQWTAYVSWMNSHGLPDLITSVQKRSDRYRANMK